MARLNKLYHFYCQAGLCLLIILLASCGTNSTKPEQPTTLEYSVDELLDNARQSASPQRELLQLQAAQKLWESAQIERAKQVLESTNAERLDVESFGQYSLLYSQIALTIDTPFAARRILTNDILSSQFGLMSTELETNLLLLRAQTYDLTGENLLSVRDRVELEKYLTDALAETNRQQLWQTIVEIPPSLVSQLISQEENDIVKGWLQLAQITVHNQNNLDQLVSAVDYWLINQPNHPAALDLPEELRDLRTVVANRPSTIALLLPLSGKYQQVGSKVRDGFLAGYYQSLVNNQYTPEIVFIDSTSIKITDLADIVLEKNIDMLIGPLRRELILELSTIENVQIPVLALNYAPDTELMSPPFQLGLAVEDESLQVSQQAWLEGFRNAVILYPDTDWGMRAFQSFRESWTDKGGSVVGSATYGDETESYSKAIASALQTESSKSRLRRIRNVTLLNMEFEPRRRQDVDFVFMIATPTAGRQLKPTLAFHYASDLPIYSTSHIYAGDQDKNKNRDLNGIRFTSLPWYFDQSELKQTLRSMHGPMANHRLYALGLDAYQIFSRIQHMEKMTSATHLGKTGVLNLDKSRKLRRKGLWTTFSSGTAKPIPLILGQDENGAQP